MKIDKECIATIGDLIEQLQKFPADTPITSVIHEDDGHHIDWEPMTKLDVQYIGLSPDGTLEISLE